MLSLYTATTAFAGPMRAGLAPGITMKASSSLPWTEAPEHLQGMIGNVDFDPWGLSTPQNIKWMREAELKHGRMCQLAWAVSRRPLPRREEWLCKNALRRVPCCACAVGDARGPSS